MRCMIRYCRAGFPQRTFFDLFLPYWHYVFITAVSRDLVIFTGSSGGDNILSTLIILCSGKTASIGVDILLRELRVCRDTSESQAALPESLRLSRINILAPLITEMRPKCNT